MKIETSLSTTQINEAASAIGCHLVDLQQRVNTPRSKPYKRGHLFTYTAKLRVNAGNDSFRAADPISGRSIGRHIPCWHGYRDFYRQLYSLDQTAKIVTGWGFTVTYTSQADFEATHPDTAYTPCGSMLYPFAYIDKCNHA